MTESIIEIDGDQAVNLLKQVVEGKEDFIYTSPAIDDGICLYIYEDEPSCGIGKALALAGVSIDSLKEMDGIGWATSIRALSERGTEKYGFTLTVDAELVFSRFQRSQDSGTSWGFCLRQAVKNSALLSPGKYRL